MRRPCRLSILLLLAAGCSDSLGSELMSSDLGGPTVDASAGALDVGANPSGPDAPAADHPPDPDTGPIALDVAPVGDAPVPRPDAGAVTADHPSTDAGPADAGASCEGAAPMVTVSAPAQDEVIETCSAAEAAVYYDFIAAVAPGSSVQRMSARWITPDGAAAPPPAELAAAPFRFRRQVGGPTTGAPPLAVFGIRGTWRFEVTATDRCGRTSTASRSFSLLFTARRCPNP